MFDNADMLFQIFIDMYSGYIARVEDDIVAVRILMELRQERQSYREDKSLSGKTTFVELVSQIDEIVQNVKEELDNANKENRSHRTCK